MAKQSVSPFQILNVLFNEGPKFFLAQEVYYLWSQVLHTNFKRNEDLLLSSELYVGSSQALDIVCFQIAPFGLYMITKLRRELIHEWSVQKLFIDTTF